MSEKPRKRVSIIEAPRRKELEAAQTNYDSSSVDFSKGPRIGCRHIQAVLLFFGVAFGIATRTNLSVAIVAMTDNTTSSNPNIKTYHWNNTSVILSSFFWSYIILQVLAGFLGRAYGPKYFLLCAYFVNCCVCALIPTAASTLGSTGVIICRIIQGFCQSFLYPSVHVLLGTWVPANERSTLNNFIFSGAPLGTILSSLLTGYISASSLGWPYSFYALAIMGSIWCILWGLLGENSPATHSSITTEEQTYIESSLKQDDVYLPTPWKNIFTCVPVYALIVAFVGNTWGYAILMTETPTYLSKIMQFDVKSNGVITALPTILSFVTALITGPLADWLITYDYLSVLKTRRMFQAIGAYGQALCLLWLGYLTQSQAHLSILVLGLSNALTAVTLAGAQINHLDLSPRFGGVIFGLLNASGQASSIAAPLVAQWVITDQTKVSQWRVIYIISATMHLIGGTVFILLSSATRQPWDGLPSKHLQKVKKISVVSLTV